MNRFVIQGKYDAENEDDFFWSNKDGWVDFDSATIFQSTELPNLNMPMETVCVSFINKENKIIQRELLD